MQPAIIVVDASSGQHSVSARRDRNVCPTVMVSKTTLVDAEADASAEQQEANVAVTAARQEEERMHGERQWADLRAREGAVRADVLGQSAIKR